MKRAPRRFKRRRNRLFRTERGSGLPFGRSEPSFDPNCDTNEPPLALGGSLCAKGVHPPMSNELQI